MTTPEMLAALESMVVLVDTREQDNRALRQRIRQIGSPCERAKLDAGDYSAKFMVNGEWLTIPVAIERKMSLDELAGNFCRGRARFKREFERAAEAGVKMYLLVEGGEWLKLYRHNYASKMSERSFIGSILAWLARYDCQILFCDRMVTGYLIRDVLYREGKEMLERMVDE